MPKEFRKFGPPGTGKTTSLATTDVPNAVKKYGPDHVMIASFTKTAAQEIASKKSMITGEAISVNPEHVGTLHALCYRALGNPVIAESKKAEWNNIYGDYYPIAGSIKGNLDEGGGDAGGNSRGDELLAALNIHRSKMLDKNIMSNSLSSFAKKWNDFKQDSGYLDFTDLISNALENIIYAPGHPRVMFSDECQDFTPLQLKLVRSWAQYMDWLVLVGDDDQAIFSFTGASPEAFLNPPVAAKYKTVLAQSYRVPRLVLERAERVIKRVSVREPKVYAPRPVEGIVRDLQGTYKNVEKLVNEIQEVAASGRKVMVLASCSYMIDGVKLALKAKGVPFWNQYRKTRGDWNPLLRGGNDKVMPVDLLTAFLGEGKDKGYWTIKQLLAWIKDLRVGNNAMIRGSKKPGIALLKQAIEDNAEGLYTSRDVLSDLLTPDAMQVALDRNIPWLLENLTKKRSDALQYPVKVLNAFGKKAIIENPMVTIGTIHSVKGGEADCVFLFPDISYNAAKEIATDNSGKAQDAIHRLFYVAMTRAKEELVLLKPVVAKRSRVPLFVDM